MKTGLLKIWAAILFSLPVAAAAQSVEAPMKAVIHDPDGYTNIRQAPNVESPIVARVVNAEVFLVIGSSGNWYLVQKAHGETGYMHKSRVAIIGHGVSTSPAHPTGAGEANGGTGQTNEVPLGSSHPPKGRP